MTTLVELTQVSKTYDGAGARAVLDEVSLDIEGGELTAIMGRREVGSPPCST
jgi:ABC-type multidrug transport system ATPase subunit